MNHQQRLAVLREHGWAVIEKGDDCTNMVPGSDGKFYRCCWILGPMHDVPRDAWLDEKTGTVLMHGEEKDYQFGEFIEELQRKPVVKKPARGLFDEE